MPHCARYAGWYPGETTHSFLSLRGAFGVIPLPRVDLHNVYNAVEMILIVLGFWYEAEARLADGEE